MFARASSPRPSALADVRMRKLWVRERLAWGAAAGAPSPCRYHLRAPRTRAAL